MHLINAANVCEALWMGAALLQSRGVDEESRAGKVRVIPTPVMTVTRCPQQRVLFSDLRDANPFFHLYEAVWMLSGRSDAAPLNRFVKDFGSQYGEKDGTVHGAYGHRWRRDFGFDQLNAVVEKLKKDRGTRQAVIQMWDCDVGANNDLQGQWNDRPCNTHIYLRIREEKMLLDADNIPGNLPLLDMTVCCRSNDAMWGCHGANAVHFSILQEYIAARVGVVVGHLYQLSNNYHIYHAYIGQLFKNAQKIHGNTAFFDAYMLHDDRYFTSRNEVTWHWMFNVPDKIDEDLIKFMDWDVSTSTDRPSFHNQFFGDTLYPAMMAHRKWKEKHRAEAMEWAGMIAAPDWRIACCEWMARRVK